jgi:hypothetical protein
MIMGFSILFRKKGRWLVDALGGGALGARWLEAGLKISLANLYSVVKKSDFKCDMLYR